MFNCYFVIIRSGFFRLVQNMFYENNCASKEPLLAVAKGSLGE